MIGAIENSLIFLELCFVSASSLSTGERQSFEKEPQGLWEHAVCSGKASVSWVPSSRCIPVETSFCCAFVASRCTQAVPGGTVALQGRG